jgi:hypothetical protein
LIHQLVPMYITPLQKVVVCCKESDNCEGW